MSSPSPEILLSLSPAVLRALLTTFGGIAGLKPGASPEGIARAIFEGAGSPKLRRILGAVVSRLSTERGKRALVEAGRAQHDPRVADWLLQRPADVAAELAIARESLRGRERRAIDRLFALAGMRLERELSELPTYELIAHTPVVAGNVVRAMEKVLGDDLHAHWTRTDADGGTTLALFLRRPTTTSRVIDRETGKAVTREDTPVAADLVRVSAEGSRVSFTLVLPELLPVYAHALGLSLRSSATLRALQTLTPEQLAQLVLPRDVRRLTVIALRVRRPDGSRYEMRAFDALDTSHDAAARRSGYVDRATIRLEFAERVIDVFVQLPHRVEVSDTSLAFAAPAREVLTAIGIFDPGVVPDDARSLAPYVHGDWRWRDVVGEASFTWLVAQKRLVRELAAHVATEEHRMHGAGYVVREVPGEPGVQYALAEDRSLGARLVGKKDRLAWRLDLGALGKAMRADLGSVEIGKPQAIDVEGVLDLGVVTLASGKLRFVYAMGAPPKGWVGIAARACGLGVTLVVFVPRGHGQSELDGVMVIELDVEEQFGVKRVGRVLGRAAEALGVGSEVETWRLYDEEIVVDAKTSRVWIQGALMPLTEKPYRFVEYLVKRAGHVSSTREIGEYVSSSEYPDVAARKTKAEVEKQVTAGLAAAGVDTGIVERLIAVEGRSGYRLGVSGRVV